MEALDTDIFLTLNSWHGVIGDPFFLLYSGRWVWIPMYAAMLYCLFRDFRWSQALIYVLGVAALITAADQMCAHVLRPIFERPRPSADGSPIAGIVQLVEGYKAGGFGFPSCHAANTMALAMFFSLVIKRWWLTWFLFLWAIVTCYSRIYLAAHYPGDLLLGSLIGIVFAWIIYIICQWIAGFIQGHRPLNKEKIAHSRLGSKTSINFYPSTIIVATGLITVVFMLVISIN